MKRKCYVDQEPRQLRNTNYVFRITYYVLRVTRHALRITNPESSEAAFYLRASGSIPDETARRAPDALCAERP